MVANPAPRVVNPPGEVAYSSWRSTLLLVHSSWRLTPVIGSHVKEILGGIRTHSPTLPPPVEAAMLSSQGEFGEAIPIWEEAYKEEPDDQAIAYGYADAP